MLFLAFNTCKIQFIYLKKPYNYFFEYSSWRCKPNKDVYLKSEINLLTEHMNLKSPFNTQNSMKNIIRGLKKENFVF